METIFDYNLSEQEKEQVAVVNKDLYMSLDDDTKLCDLAMLFYIRGNYKQMKHFIKKVKDFNLRNSFYRTIYHP